MYKPEKRKPLRVSEPIGIQRSSYFISLPLRYGVPLFASSSILQWLISQSLFLARITAMNPDGTADRANSFSTCGYSPIAIIISMSVQYMYTRSSPSPLARRKKRRASLLSIKLHLHQPDVMSPVLIHTYARRPIALFVGLGLVLFIIVLGFARKYDGTMRMVSTNSMAISAACHSPHQDRADGYVLPVRWGVTEMSENIGHCAFTTAPDSDLMELEDGATYR